MNTAELLIEAYSRVPDGVARLLDGLDDPGLTARPDAEANSIAWLVWHLSRGQDTQIADVADTEQAWTADGWAERFALPFDVSATGYGQSADEVGEVRASAADSCAATSPTSTGAPWSSSAPSPRRTSTGSSTSGGTRRSRSACGW